MPPGTLYVVATPLGHLGDLSPRAADTLRSVHTVAAEDTRRTRKLLTVIEAHPRLLSYHAHSEPRRLRVFLQLLADGHDVALVTDAGTPGISDPGTELVAQAREVGYTVVPIPGPSAVMAAVAASGIPGDRFLFLGFIPRKGTDRRHFLERIASEQETVVAFEAANRLTDLLADLSGYCGAERKALVARELTKVHEETRAGTLEQLHAYYMDTPARGEVTLVVAGRGVPTETADAVNPAEVAALVRERLEAGDSRKDVVRIVVTRFGLARNDAYRFVMDDSQ